MTTFREYRAVLAAGGKPVHAVPALPSEDEAIQGQRAGFVSRATAAIIDVVLVFVVVLGTAAAYWMLTFIIQPTTSQGEAFSHARVPPVWLLIAYGYALNVAYWTIGWATGGRTIGNLILGVRVVNFRGKRVHWAGAFVRALFCTLFVPGLLWVIISGTNRSVQDVVLRTSVIHDWVVEVPGLTRKEHL